MADCLQKRNASLRYILGSPGWTLTYPKSHYRISGVNRRAVQGLYKYYEAQCELFFITYLFRVSKIVKRETLCPMSSSKIR